MREVEVLYPWTAEKAASDRKEAEEAGLYFTVDKGTGERYRWISEGAEVCADGYTTKTSLLDGAGVTLYGKGEAVAISRSIGTRSGMRYLGKDLLGSVRSVTIETGTLEDRYEYDAFGTPYQGDLANGMNLGYTGKPYDTATGLYNYGYRDYRPETARFTTIDPIRDGNNWFAYVNNDPVNYVDLWGLSANEPEAKVQTTLSEQEIGNIVFNETRSLNGTGVQAARENIAHAIINADEKWGSNRSTYAGTAPATVTENAKNTDAEQYKSSQKAASDAVSTHLENDPTNGAVFFNFRSNDSRSNFQGAEIQTQVGPLNNSYPTADLPGTGIYANTYK